MILNRRGFLCVFILSIGCLCINSCTGSESINESRYSSEHDFDILIFTQRWPITDCMTWMGKGNDHKCVLPSQKDNWIIHGVWPTKFNTLGPFYCNKSVPFDIHSLEPIMDQMKQYWTNIEKGTPVDSLWQHEWEKHGTCARIIEDLSSENKYFGQGLAWLQQYTMSGLLSKANINPGSQYNAIDLHNAIKGSLNTNPSIHCVREKRHYGEQYLSEIKICFNKKLELVNCDGILGHSSNYVDDRKVITNCDPNNEIIYPSTLPQYLIDRVDREQTKPVWRFPWINIYKLIEMIKWLTF